MIREILRDGYILTEQECVEKGGHKYDNYTNTLLGLLSRVCRYCGHRQRGYNPPPVWEDVKE